ncbi:hypothetical protein [Pseudoroseicyclus sp. CXY001]|uniref:hypothetical protein n=1 Tax=Pseudoroseicyclus sp. CXY001 TaxID=3242492 RepID=UPI003570FAE5
MRAVLALAALAVGAAACTVRPTGAEVAWMAAGEDWPALAERLRARGFFDLPATASGPRDGACLEKVRGGALAGIDVVRACEGPGAPRVWRMNTHREDWTELSVSR